jgi:hypothetical protein
VVITLGTVSSRLGQSSNLLFFLTNDYDLFLLVRKFADYLVALRASVAAFRACHQDLLFLFGREKGRPAFGAKLQNLCRTKRTSSAEFIVYLAFCGIDLVRPSR